VPIRDNFASVPPIASDDACATSRTSPSLDVKRRTAGEQHDAEENHGAEGPMACSTMPPT
jgi:hypothetical protein